MRKFVGLIAAFVLVSCGHPPQRTVIEVTTRAGATYIVVDPITYYLRVCDEGLVPSDGDADNLGLRAQGASSADVEVPWTSLGSIQFGKPIGDLAQTTHMCSGVPDAVAATVTMKHGSVSQKNFVDTTDEGITGRSERGLIIVPIRAIAKLAVIEDGKWPWAEEAAIRKIDDEVPTLRVTEDGQAQTYDKAGDIDIRHHRYAGSDELAGPETTVHGYPLVLGGATVVVPWDRLRKIEVIAKDGRPLTASSSTFVRLTFDDGHTEEGGVLDAGIDLEGSVHVSSDPDLQFLPSIEVLAVLHPPQVAQ
jgi:hypothetical protein